MRKRFTGTARAAVVAAALGFTLGAAPFVLAQDAVDGTRAPTTATDDGTDWGWIGLLGLAGLAGLMRRDRNATHATYQTAAHSRP